LSQILLQNVVIYKLDYNFALSNNLFYNQLFISGVINTALNLTTKFYYEENL